MKTWEAVKALGDGKKVRLKYWERGRYIYRTEDGRISDDTGDVVYINLTFRIIDDEWEEYKEGWQNVEVKNIWDLPAGVVDMVMVSSANCPYCDKKTVTLRILGDCKYCPYCGKQVIK